MGRLSKFLNKAFELFLWEDFPSVDTPLGKRLLNKINNALNEVDNRVIELNTSKLDIEDAQNLVKKVEYDRSTGVFTITYLNGAVATIDTLLEKLIINFDFDKETQQLIIYMDDGSLQYVDLSALITEYEFVDSETIAFVLDRSGKVSAKVKEGSIEEKHLRPNYLAEIKIEAGKAETSASAASESEGNAKISEAAAKTSETNAAASATSALESKTTAAQKAAAASESDTNAANSATNAADSAAAAANKADAAAASAANAADSAGTATTEAAAAAASANNASASAASADDYAGKSQSYAVGGTGTREGEDSDNSKYYAEKARESADKAEEIAGENFIPNSEKGAENGVATLDDTGKVPKPQIPSLTAGDVGALPEDGNAVSATKAEQDGNGSVIAETYAEKPEAVEALVPASWEGTEAPYSITVPVEGVTDSNTVIISPGLSVTKEQYDVTAGASIMGTEQADGTVTLKAFGEKPEIPVPLQFIIQN